MRSPIWVLLSRFGGRSGDFACTVFLSSWTKQHLTFSSGRWCLLSGKRDLRLHAMYPV